MNDSMPVGNQPEFKESALNQVFSFPLTRKQCIILVNVLRPIQLPISDIRSKVLREILESIEERAIQSIRPSDYEDPTKLIEEIKSVVTT